MGTVCCAQGCLQSGPCRKVWGGRVCPKPLGGKHSQAKHTGQFPQDGIWQQQVPEHQRQPHVFMTPTQHHTIPHRIAQHQRILLSTVYRHRCLFQIIQVKRSPGAMIEKAEAPTDGHIQGSLQVFTGASRCQTHPEQLRWISHVAPIPFQEHRSTHLLYFLYCQLSHLRETPTDPPEEWKWTCKDWGPA